MRKSLLFTLPLLLTSYSAFGQGSLKVLTEAISVREVPNGNLIETLNKDQELPLRNLLGYWGRSEGGWLNCDYTDFKLPLFNKTGEIELTVAKALEDGERIKKGDVIVVYRELPQSVIGVFKEEPLEVGKDRVSVERDTFDVVVANFPIKLYDSFGNQVEVRAGIPLLKNSTGYLFSGHFWERAERVDKRVEVNREELLKEINRLIDIFNSVKLSSPLSKRLGYYVKTLPVRSEDLQLEETPTGTGAFLKLRYQFITKDGRKIRGRKTRLFLKRSNFEFWKKLTEKLFNSGVNKFVEIDVYRFNGNGGFEKGGFVASSYHNFREGKIKDYESFVENSESNLIEDLWFFADQVYERLEGGDD
ncbi:hypothetical protein C7457_0820 [Thermovibrio guaymasensis]|uniref:Uncharacterized protein n=1 Tax=Thermovibrio guaymasensis TaxID=240167 RepID=A0A420W9C1_9BACT|nr:hypothetical protein [Thermovibrio guaymasensis]RKQ63931.1 hypothetical protein C7457_0820 [Thermovibrio guaymasensis]